MATTEQFAIWLKEVAEKLGRTPEQVEQETGDEASDAFQGGDTVDEYVKHFLYEELLYADRQYS
jgi:hypothetical protein